MRNLRKSKSMSSFKDLFCRRELSSYIPAVSVPPTTLDCYTVLRSLLPERRRFDVKSTTDLKELSFFIKNHTWKNSCPFYLEWPYTDIPTMCKSKLTEYVLKKVK
jgi:hypothetical protein